MKYETDKMKLPEIVLIAWLRQARTSYNYSQQYIVDTRGLKHLNNKTEITYPNKSLITE